MSEKIRKKLITFFKRMYRVYHTVELIFEYFGIDYAILVDAARGISSF